jgi:hypothetical protein
MDKGPKTTRGETVHTNLISSVVGLNIDVSGPFARAESDAGFLRPEDSVSVENAPARTLNRVLHAAKTFQDCQFLSPDDE